MNRLKRFITSRRVVISLIGVAVLELLVGVFFPQRFLTPPATLAAWYAAHPFLERLAGPLGLDHLYTSPLFSLTILLFSISLAVSSYDQFGKAWRLTFGPPAATAGDFLAVRHGEAAVSSLMRAKGYWRMFGDEQVQRFVRHPWGYWGRFLLHLGMVLVIVAALTVFLTMKRGLVELYEGQVFTPADALAVAETGLLAERLRLPVAVRMASIVTEFWETGDLKQLATVLEFGESGGAIREQRLAINETIRYKGLQVYQSPTAGRAFFLEFVEANGKRHREILMLPRPLKKDAAGYRDFVFPWLLSRLQTKYYADVGKESLDSERPLFVLRLAADDEKPAELSLAPGASGTLGPYQVRLSRTENWAGVIFVEESGMAGVFFGFFVIILGATLIYCTPPRDVVLRRSGDGCLIGWTAARFAGFYQGEMQELIRALGEAGRNHSAKGNNE
ncbi:MAG: hypothetical protein A2521_09280 [Deltaproteobacteria bacterium RIFOXYD12_FULL_57_12]|nr:MAG: hypothetical protein A2521_09280 [Deltaproteobacteria bacterium RIFOXYD12_FULL_57_12]